MATRRTEKAPIIRGQPQISRAKAAKHTTKASRHRPKSINQNSSSNNNRTSRKMIYSTNLLLLASLSLFALGANASLFSFSFTSSPSSSSDQFNKATTTTTTTTPAPPRQAPVTGANNNFSSANDQQDLSSAQSVGDLVAIGAISLLDSPQSQQNAVFATTSQAELVEAANQKNKLDYIIDFMRANKLTKFCDLITSQETPVRQLSGQLNDLAQFTLFVPTNEALLLMASGQLEQIKRQPELLRQFIGAHATDELVIPRMPLASQRPSSLVSLSGGQLRIASVTPPANTTTGTGTGSKLELIVNGANVLSGNSYALQEPNNNKVTYAIVHLIDRVLYPMPSGRLVDKVRSLAPKMARYFEMAASSDRQLREALASGGGSSSSDNLWTLFLPGDAAFEATPAKLTEQLESNRTFLIEFLRGHLIDGLYFSQQLALISSNRQQPTAQQQVKLVSLSGKLLEIESKTVQSRQLVLINSTPLLEADIMALNGVVHLVSRPILERHLADDCDCATSTSTNPANHTSSNFRGWPPSDRLLAQQPQRSANVVTYEVDNRGASPNWAARRPVAPKQETSSSIQYSRGGPETGNNLSELEREESRVTGTNTNLGPERTRSQRSGSLLIERNNHDFYRPSTAPANLLAAAPEERPAAIILAGGDKLLGRETAGSGVAGSQDASKADSFDGGVDRYKVVLNADTRQRLRDAQRNENQTLPTSRFAYDRPLIIGSSSTTPTTTNIDFGRQPQAPTPPSSFLIRRPYTPTPAPQQSASIVVQDPNVLLNNQSSSNLQDQLTSSSILSRQQQMIKFQPEDARDPAAGDSLSRLTSKTVAPPLTGSGGKATLNNCAFYDTDCRRLSGKLVRLPPVRNRLQQQQTDNQTPSLKSALMQTSSSNTTFARITPPTIQSSVVGDNLRPSQMATNDAHLDSTFGETDSGNTSRSQQQQQQLFGNSNTRGQQQQQLRPIIISPVRVSPLVQPLPPWSSDEEPQLVNRGNQIWRTGAPKTSLDTDLARLKGPAYGFTSGISRNNPTSASPMITNVDNKQQQQQQQHTTAEILLLPVKIVHEPIVLTNATAASSSFIERPQQQQQPQQQQAPFASNNNRQFHTPTPYSVSIATTHMPSMFMGNNQPARQQLGRLTNFTALEYVPEESPAIPQRQPSSKRLRFESSSSTSTSSNQSRLVLQQNPINSLKSPSALRRQKIQQQQQQQQSEPNIHLESPKQLGRKVVRVNEAQQPVDEYTFGGDMSVTSAKLTNFSTGSLLATQASNVSTNFVRSVALPPATSSSSGIAATDFFQDRTIAEIMDDSGLRIDGQQVTFSRFKECLQEAKLLNLVTQTDNSLTIFMPTDMAFQRLVQQQALLQQQQQNQQRESRQSPFLSSASSQQSSILPLMVRSNRAQQQPTASSRLSAGIDATDSTRIEPASSGLASVGDRLTLDCQSQQVRKLLLDHLSARLVQPKQLTLDTSITSLNGHQLLLSSVPSKKIVVVDGQPVIAATRAKNGMVYVVNKFLNITHQMPNMLELMETQPNLTTFLSYLSFSSMSDRLKRETGPLTILAPTNEAFEQLTPAARQLINSDPAALADIIRGHIVEGAQFGKLIPMRSQLKTMNSDQMIEAKVIKPNVYMLDNQMTSMRLVGTTGNGVVNAVDRLIVPAWLKVSMTSKPAAAAASSSSSANIELTSDSNPQPGTRVRHQSVSSLANLNLPTITNQPLRFEQPTNRFSAPSGRDSFLLNSSSSQSSSGSGNNNLLLVDGGFEHTTLSPTTSSEPSSSSRLSPFAATRLPDNELSFLNRSVTSGKNMQLIEKLAQLMQAKKFVKYLLRSGVSEKLKPDMNYVILVPTDQAIEKLPKQIIDLLERDKDRLADLINYHVLDTTFEYINTIPDGQTLNTLNEKDILFNWHRNNTILTASGAVVMGGIQEENIALLIVDRVLYPTPGDILNIISKSPILSNFTSLVRNAGLEKQLSLAGPFTLFAPSDFAFNQLSKNDLDLLQRNKETARRFLLRHLSQPAVFTSSIALSNSTTSRQQSLSATTNQQQVPQMIISNSLGEELTLRQRSDYFSVNEVNFSYADVAATNGVVHVIDGLL